MDARKNHLPVQNKQGARSKTDRGPGKLTIQKYRCRDNHAARPPRRKGGQGVKRKQGIEEKIHASPCAERGGQSYQEVGSVKTPKDQERACKKIRG